MNTFIDVARRSSLNGHTTKNFNDTKQSNAPKSQTPLNPQATNLNSTRTHQIISNSQKNRRKQQTNQLNGKRRSFGAGPQTHNNNNKIINRTNGNSSNLNANNNSNANGNDTADDRNYRRLNANTNNDRNNASDFKCTDEPYAQCQDSFDATHSTNTTSGISSNCSESSCDSTKSHKNSNQKLNTKSNDMDIRSTRLIIAHPTAHQSPAAPISLLSPNTKAIYSLDYLHQVGAQLTDGFRTQPGEFFNSQRSTYANYRYNSSGNSMTTSSSHVSDTSISPPLSITSSGSSNNSGKSNRSSKSTNRISNRSFTNSQTSMNGHRTQQMPQPHVGGFYQSQNIPFFHSSSSNGMQQMFASNLSPNTRSQQSGHSNGIFAQPNATSAYHANNNYHSHNRNYNSNGNKKQWNVYNNNRYNKNKTEPNGNGNYKSSSSESSKPTNPAIKTPSSSTPAAMPAATIPPPRKDTSTASIAPTNEKQIQTDTVVSQPVTKKPATKDVDIESPTVSLKNFILSDSETSNPKLKMPPADYFSLSKTKSSSCTSSLSLSTGASTFQLNGNISTINNRTVSHPGLISIDVSIDDSKHSAKSSAHTEHAKTGKTPMVNFSYGGRPNFSSSTNYISSGTMLTEEMLLNGTNSTRYRYMGGRPNMQFLAYAPTEYFANSPIRTKSFGSGKRRSSTPNNRPSIGSNANANANLNNSRNQEECEVQRALQYRSRVNEVKMTLNELCNGSEWDNVSQKIWTKYESRRQPQELYEKKTYLWTYLCDKIRTIFSRYSLYLVGSTISGFALDTSDVDMCLVSRLSTTLDPRGEAVYHLDRLRHHLQENCQTFLKNFNLIPAKVPILRFDDKHHNVEVDLNYNNCVGIRNSHLLHCYTQLDWRLQPLAVIVKLWAQHHDINNAKDLTISSYSLILMVIHYLQCGVQPAILPCLHAMYPDKFQKINDIDTINMNEKIEPYHSDNHQTLGELFHGFLQYYCHFNYERYAISIRTASVLPIERCRNDQTHKNDPNEWKQLCIEEPFDRSNTARSCCDEKIFDRIKKVFYESWIMLDETKDLDVLFGEALVPPAFNAIYDNYIQPMTIPHMEYMMR